MIRVLIVDDEAPARKRMRRLLGSHADIEIAGEAENGLQALEQIQFLGPDAVFLDIDMPELDGLEVASSLFPANPPARPHKSPAVIFVTAYDEHAIKAFELSALDYLVKPVTEARLESALRKLRQLRRQNACDPKISSALLEMLRKEPARPRKFAIRSDAKFVVVDPSRISAILARDHYSAILTEGKELLSDDPMDEVLSRLDPERFIRIHRSGVINIDFLRELEREGDRKYTAVLSDPARTRVPISRDRLDELKGRLGL